MNDEAAECKEHDDPDTSEVDPSPEDLGGPPFHLVMPPVQLWGSGVKGGLPVRRPVGEEHVFSQVGIHHGNGSQATKHVEVKQSIVFRWLWNHVGEGS